MENELIIGGVTISLIIPAIVEALKQAGLPTRFAFLTSLLIGAGFGIASALTLGTGMLQSLVLGLVSGSAASGFYSGLKYATEQEKK